MPAENPPQPPAPDRLPGVPEDVDTIEWDQVPTPPEVSSFEEVHEQQREEAVKNLEQRTKKQEDADRRAANVIRRRLKETGVKQIDWNEVPQFPEMTQREFKEYAKAQSLEQLEYEEAVKNQESKKETEKDDEKKKEVDKTESVAKKKDSKEETKNAAARPLRNAAVFAGGATGVTLAGLVAGGFAADFLASQLGYSASIGSAGLTGWATAIGPIAGAGVFDYLAWQLFKSIREDGLTVINDWFGWLGAKIGGGGGAGRARRPAAGGGHGGGGGH